MLFCIVFGLIFIGLSLFFIFVFYPGDSDITVFIIFISLLCGTVLIAILLLNQWSNDINSRSLRLMTKDNTVISFISLDGAQFVDNKIVLDEKEIHNGEIKSNQVYSIDNDLLFLKEADIEYPLLFKYIKTNFWMRLLFLEPSQRAYILYVPRGTVEKYKEMLNLEDWNITNYSPYSGEELYSIFKDYFTSSIE